MMSVKFVDTLPASNKGPKSTAYMDVAEELRSKPNQWALVWESTSPTRTTVVNNGTLKAFRPAGDFEATGRSNKEGTIDVYVRFVG